MNWVNAAALPDPFQIVVFFVQYPDKRYTCCGYSNGTSWTEMTAWGMKTHDRRYVTHWAHIPAPTKRD